MYAGVVVFLLIAVCCIFNTKYSVLVLVIFIGLVFGYWYVARTFVENEYINFIGNEINLEGKIVVDPVMSGSNQQITLLPDGFTQNIKASLYTPMPDAGVGDRVWIRGNVELPENFSEFDYIDYLQRQDVYAVLKKPRVIVLKKNHGG